MTAPVSTTPISIDYTNRDYYAIRQALIERVSDRTGAAWKGTDANDFGLALIEAFAYMGDLLNYYIDRVANESYLLTATQRESLLNIAAMYGYRPANYVSAFADLSITNNNGYTGDIGGAIIEGGTIGETTLGNYAKVIVPNDHPFGLGQDEFNAVTVRDIPESVTSTLGGDSITYYTSVYNGTFPVKNVGFDTYGSNVVWYRPEAGISSISTGAGTFTVTLSDAAPPSKPQTLIPSVNQKVLISGVTVTGGDGYDGKWVISEATDTTFTVTTANAEAGIRKAFDIGTAFRYSYNMAKDITVGQKVAITGVKTSTNSGGTANTEFNFTSAAVTDAKDIAALVTNVSASGTAVTYTSSKEFEVDDIVSVYGVKSVGNEDGTVSLGYNLQDVLVTEVANLTASISDVTPDTYNQGRVTFTSVGHNILVGDYVTISGVTPTVYNMSEARVISATVNTFTVEAFWDNEFDAINSASAAATVYKFKVASTATGQFNSSGSAVCKQFTVADDSRTPGTWATSATAKVAPLVGGTATVTSAEVVYAELPVVVLSNAGKVANVGETVVPAGTQVYAQVAVDAGVKEVIFSTQSDLAVPFKSTESVTAVHGEDVSLRDENAAGTDFAADIAGELLGRSNGRATQKFALKEIEVAPRTVRVWVHTGTGWEEWTSVEHIQDFGPSSKVFQVDVSASEVVSVVFGDGVSGLIPTNSSGIKAAYIAGGGTIGNIGAETLTKWKKVVGNDASVILDSMTVTNLLPAAGGGNPESNDSIRYNAPRALRTLNRAVTLEDFANLSLSVDGVAKANAVASSRSSVTVYVSPVSDDVADPTPGFVDGSGFDSEVGELTPQMLDLMSDTSDYLSDKVQIGTTVTILAPVYTKVVLGASYSVAPNFSPSIVAANLKKAILADFSYNNVGFEDVLTPEEVEFKLRQVDGVTNVRVTALHRDGGTGRNSLVGFADEILVFGDAEITLEELGSTAALSGIAFSAGTFTPSFNPNVFTYSLTVPSGTTAVDVTPTLSGVGAAVTVNDVAGTSGAAVSDVAVENGSFIVTSVTAENGLAVQSYKFKVTVAP